MLSNIKTENDNLHSVYATRKMLYQLMVSKINSHYSLRSLSTGNRHSILLLIGNIDSEEPAASSCSFFPEDGSSRLLQNINTHLLDCGLLGDNICCHKTLKILFTFLLVTN
jgi:hypothetical protein